MTDHDFELRLRADLRALAEPASAEVRAQIIAIPDESANPLDRRPAVLRFAPLALAAAAVLAIVLVGIGLWVRPPDVGPTPVPTAEPSTSMLPDLGLPGMAPGAPGGAYGWTGSLGSGGGLHRVRGDRITSLFFAVENDCFSGAGAEPTAIRVAGLDGLYVEPYDSRDVVFGPMAGAKTTRAYALPIGDRTLCVYATWNAATTQDDVQALNEVVESIRGMPFGDNGIRINFILGGGWDTG